MKSRYLFRMAPMALAGALPLALAAAVPPKVGAKAPDFVLQTLNDQTVMVNSYGVRWNATGETSYSSTLILDRKGVIRFARTSHSHDGRTKAGDIVTELKRPASD